MYTAVLSINKYVCIIRNQIRTNKKKLKRQVQVYVYVLKEINKQMLLKFSIFLFEYFQKFLI